MARGVFIQAPHGTGKSTWISKLPSNIRKYTIDGDELLAKKNIKNYNYFWYKPKYSKEREEIWKVFQEILHKGYTILYSGNPIILPTDLIILPPARQRWEQLQRRRKEGGFIPEKKYFIQEEKYYRSASQCIRTIRGNIPNMEEIRKALQE